MKNRIAGILSEQNPSIYLYGSIALNDYKPGWSDIDILCLTDTPITGEQAQRLVCLRQELLREYAGNPYFRSFEGGMLTTGSFFDGTPGTVVYWGTGGQRITDRFYFDPFSKIELLESGILLHGGDVRKRLRAPTHEEVIDGVARYHQIVRNQAGATGRSFYSAGWLFDIARCIYTLRTGKIIAKTKAGEWALREEIVPDRSVMEKALKIRKDPLLYQNDAKAAEWLGTLEKPVLSFADVLKEELRRAAG